MPAPIPEYRVHITTLVDQLIVGTLFGDAHAAVPCKNPRLSITHSIKDLLYLEWKYDILSSCGLVESPIHFPSYERSGRINSICHTSLWKYRRLFYPNGRKTITPDAMNMLTPLSLAVWYMDDGNFYHRNNSGTIRLYTLAFSEDENRLAARILRERFGFQLNVTPYRSKFILTTSRGKDVVSFHNTVRAYIHPCMVRKCPDVYISTGRDYSNQLRDSQGRYTQNIPTNERTYP